MDRFTSGGTLSGSWTFPNTYLGSPNGVAMDASDNVFVTDYDGHRVLKYTSAGVLLTSWSTSLQPVDIAVDAAGSVYVMELGGQRVEKYSNSGSLVATVGSAGTGAGQFQSPNGIGLDASGRIYVTDNVRLRVLRFLADGTFDMEFAVPGMPQDVGVDPDGNIWVIRNDTNQLREYAGDGTLVQTYSSPAGFNGAFRIAISPTGVMFITDEFITYRVSKFQIEQPTAVANMSLGRVKAMYR